MLFPDSLASNQFVIHDLQCASPTLVILFMTVTNTEHAPTAGTAFGLSTSVPVNSAIFILSFVPVISIVRIIMYRRLNNLI